MKTASIDAVISFTHEGTSVVATVVCTQWNGGSSMLYIWCTTAGQLLETNGIPADAVLIADA